MKKVILGLVLGLILISSTAFAFPLSTAKLSWTLPTATVDGQPLNADTAITAIKVSCGTTSGIYTVTKSVGLVVEYLASDMPLTVGTWYCVVKASNKYGESAPSNSKQFILEGSVPAAITDLTIQ